MNAATISPIEINASRLHRRIEAMAMVGAIDGGGVNRLALNDADGEARRLLVRWLNELNLDVSVDAIGNISGIHSGDAAPDEPGVVIGSHIDSVATGGRFDGTLGVLAGIETIETLRDNGIKTRRPIAVASFTNEEGARFAPDMLGSAVHQGSLALSEALQATDRDGLRLGDCLRALDFCGDQAVPGPIPYAFVELHIEQGPILEAEGITIGAVESVQGISWNEYVIDGVSNHAGTTPMSMRHDAGYAAAQLAVRAREIANEMGGAQVATVGAIELEPNLINVVARRATITVDLRNVDEELLQHAEALMTKAVDEACEREGVRIRSRKLARFEPVDFDKSMVDRVETWAARLGHSVRRMPSGAGHDAQMFAPNCPTGMIFVPSKHGISHNVKEFTSNEDIEAGANLLTNLVLELANES